MFRQVKHEQSIGSPTSRWACRPAHRQDVEFVRVGSLRLRISRQGAGPPLLLIGGLGHDLGVWHNLVRRLPDFETIAVDAPGTGFSTTPVLPMSMAELAEVYAGLLAGLGLAQVTVLGHSMGGAVAQQLAHQTPDLVSGLVLCGTGPGAGGVPATLPALKELASPVLSFPTSIYGYYCQLAALVGWTSFPWLASIEAPTLVIAGEADSVYPLANARLLGRLIPTARVAVVTGGGHQFVVHNADEVAPLVRAFIEPTVSSGYAAVAV